MHHNKQHIFYIAMDETTKYTSHMSWSIITYECRKTIVCCSGNLKAPILHTWKLSHFKLQHDYSLFQCKYSNHIAEHFQISVYTNKGYKKYKIVVKSQ
jgi:hypothetical protein